MRRLAFILALLLAWPAQANELSGKATAIDGDTIELRSVRIRLAGMDAPEMQWPSGQYAAAFMQAMLDAVEIRCVLHGRDKYDRVLATCYGPRGADLAQNMVLMGHAINAKSYLPDYSEAEELARVNCKGIWSGRFCQDAIHSGKSGIRGPTTGRQASLARYGSTDE